MTADGATLYLHVFDWPQGGRLLVPGLKNPVAKTYSLANAQALKTRQTDAGVEVSLPSRPTDAVDSVIVMQVSGPLAAVLIDKAQQPDGSLVLSAAAAYLHNNEGSRQIQLVSRDGTPHLGYWTDPNAWVEWSVKIPQPGQYELWAELAVAEARTRFGIGLPNQQVSAEVLATGGYYNFVMKSLGTLKVDRTGDYRLRINPDPQHWQPINLRQVVLKKQ